MKFYEEEILCGLEMVGRVDVYQRVTFRTTVGFLFFLSRIILSGMLYIAVLQNEQF